MVVLAWSPDFSVCAEITDSQIINKGTEKGVFKRIQTSIKLVSEQCIHQVMDLANLESTQRARVRFVSILATLHFFYTC